MTLEINCQEPERQKRMIRLEYERKANGLTQKRLAELAGMKAEQISAIERGRTFVWDGWKTRLANALGWEDEPAKLFENVELY